MPNVSGFTLSVSWTGSHTDPGLYEHEIHIIHLHHIDPEHLEDLLTQPRALFLGNYHSCYICCKQKTNVNESAYKC